MRSLNKTTFPAVYNRQFAHCHLSRKYKINEDRMAVSGRFKTSFHEATIAYAEKAKMITGLTD